MTNVFSGKKRGEQVVVTARGEYEGYDFADVVRLCKAVESGEIILRGWKRDIRSTIQWT